MREGVEKPVHALKNGARTEKAATRKQHSADTGLCGPSRMQPFGPGALSQIFDDASRKACCNAERVDHLFGVEAERGTNAGRSTHRAKTAVGGNRPYALGTTVLRRHMTSVPTAIRAVPSAIRLVPLASRQHRRHDHRTGARPAFEGVVEILAVCCRAVDEGGTRGTCCACVNRCAGASSSQLARRSDVIFVTRSDAQTDNINEQVFAFCTDSGRQLVCAERNNTLSQMFSDGGRG